MKPWRHVAETVRLWQERRKQRQGLAILSDHMLQDIGVSRRDAIDEIGKPFWRH